MPRDYVSVFRISTGTCVLCWWDPGRAGCVQGTCGEADPPRAPAASLFIRFTIDRGYMTDAAFLDAQANEMQQKAEGKAFLPVPR